MGRKNGNVPPKEGIPSTPPVKYKEGDVVALTAAALRIGRLSKMTPRLLHQKGHPNEFVVISTFEKGEDGVCLELWPCCNGFLDPKTGNILCQGHHAVYFEKVDQLRMPKKGDKGSSLILPFLGEVFGMSYFEDEENPEISANLFGMKGSASGHFAKILKKLAEDAKIL